MRQKTGNMKRWEKKIGKIFVVRYICLPNVECKRWIQFGFEQFQWVISVTLSGTYCTQYTRLLFYTFIINVLRFWRTLLIYSKHHFQRIFLSAFIYDLPIQFQTHHIIRFQYGFAHWLWVCVWCKCAESEIVEMFSWCETFPRKIRRKRSFHFVGENRVHSAKRKTKIDKRYWMSWK